MANRCEIVDDVAFLIVITDCDMYHTLPCTFNISIYWCIWDMMQTYSSFVKFIHYEKAKKVGKLF